jgi:hypothetical protein
MPDDVLKRIRDAYAEIASMPPPRTDPIKLTQAQFDQLRTAVPARSDPDPAAVLTGVPIVLVDSTVESTPYSEGWLKCPSCRQPANGHENTACDLTLVFGPFGDFAVRTPTSAFSFEPPLVRARAVDALVQARQRLRGLVADRRDQATVLDRWMDDGGSYE